MRNHGFGRSAYRSRISGTHLRYNPQVFREIGYKVNYARNYTDVDDKIIAKSKETGIPPLEYASMMIDKIDKLMRKFEVDDPTIWLKATCNIDNIIDFVSKLIEKGHAYATDRGDVYFSVESFPGYGKLSGRKLEDAYESVRIENEENKRNPLDFALWKSAKKAKYTGNRRGAKADRAGISNVRQ